ncbi:MAG: hypothetical protein ACXWL5_01030 [Candidatus Chromulinivorax sp.]
MFCLLFCLFFSLLSGYDQKLNVVFLQSKSAFDHFLRAYNTDSLESYQVMKDIFTATDFRYRKLKHFVHADIIHIKSLLKKNKNQELAKLLDDLQHFYRYVKSHKVCHKAIMFHEYLSKKYYLAFNNPNIVQALEGMPDLYGVDRYKYKSKAYFNTISADLKKLDKFEDDIHADHVILKAHNYVYRIELIKVRNYIYHDILYKFQSRYF